jgi:hypothetical protein
MITKIPPEERVAVMVSRELVAQGWQVYPELGGLCDITAVNPQGDLIGIEVKATANLGVLAQAEKHVRMGVYDFVYVAFPKRGWTHVAVKDLAGLRGIGVVLTSERYENTTTQRHVEIPCVDVIPGKRLHVHRLKKREAMKHLMVEEARVHTTPGRSSPRTFTEFRFRELVIYKHLVRMGVPVPTLDVVAMERAYLKDNPGMSFKWRPDGRTIREYAKKAVFSAIQHDATTDTWTVKAAWGSKEAGHSPVDYSKVIPGSKPDTFLPRQPEIVSSVETKGVL